MKTMFKTCFYFLQLLKARAHESDKAEEFEESQAKRKELVQKVQKHFNASFYALTIVLCLSFLRVDDGFTNTFWLSFWLLFFAATFQFIILIMGTIDWFVDVYYFPLKHPECMYLLTDPKKYKYTLTDFN